MAEFSLLIPTLNPDANKLRRCLQSIIEQTSSDIEVLINDSSSTSQTRLICSELHDQVNIKYYYSEPMGVYSAMNYLLPHVTGNWLIFMGADDRLYSCHTLELLQRYISLNPTSYHQTVCALSIYRSDIGHCPIRLSNYIKVLNSFINCLPHQALAYHKSLFYSRKYNESFSLFSDYILNSELLHSKDVRFISIPLTLINYDITGLSNGQTKKTVLNELLQVNKHLDKALPRKLSTRIFLAMSIVYLYLKKYVIYLLHIS